MRSRQAGYGRCRGFVMYTTILFSGDNRRVDSYVASSPIMRKGSKWEFLEFYECARWGKGYISKRGLR